MIGSSMLKKVTLNTAFSHFPYFQLTKMFFQGQSNFPFLVLNHHNFTFHISAVDRNILSFLRALRGAFKAFL
jgi:hypothetical protein